MGQQDLFERTVASIHEAMLDDDHWPAAAALIDQTCGIEGHELVVTEGPPHDTRFVLARIYYRGQRHEVLERVYPKVYFHQDERVPRLRRLPDSKLVHVSELYSDRELKTSATYNEALPQASFQNGLNVRTGGLNGSRITWVIGDPSDSSFWCDRQIATVQQLLPHIRQFVRVRQALVNAEALGASVTRLLDNTRVGVVQLDRRGVIMAVNDRARAILKQGDGLADRGGFLRARLPVDDARLMRLLSRALPAYGGEAAGGSMTIQRLPSIMGLALHISPVTVKHMDVSAGRVAALVLIVDPQSQFNIDPDLVASALGLTISESRVAAWIAEGRTVRDIAVATRRKESSVRWLIRQIYDKQGISRQADLVRLVLPLAGSGGSMRDSPFQAS